MEGNSIKSFENLCKIFEMKIKLNRKNGIPQDETVRSNYEKYAKKIDDIYNDVFAKEIRDVISPKKTIEEEAKRLEKLISLLDGRLEKRHNLEDRYYETTGEYLSSLQPIVSISELNEKKDRLDLINKYLNTKSEIDNITEDVAEMKNDLLEEEKKKEEYAVKNKIMEDELYSLFIGAIRNDDFYSNLDEENLDSEISEASSKATEAKETLDITLESVNSLEENGMDDDYASYIEEASRGYYLWKNRELILRIYGLVVVLDDDFEKMCDKRYSILDIISERNNLKQELKIDSLDEFFEFEKSLDNQVNTLKEEREVLTNINNYNSRIQYKEDKLAELEKVINSVEVLSILREYGLVETYKDDMEDEMFGEDDPSDMPLELDSENTENLEEPENNSSDPYRILEVKDHPMSLNVTLAKLKGESVREKVKKKLNPDMAMPTFDDLVNGEDLDSNLQDDGKEDNSVNTWEVPIDINVGDTTISSETLEKIDGSEKAPKGEDLLKEAHTEMEVSHDSLDLNSDSTLSKEEKSSEIKSEENMSTATSSNTEALYVNEKASTGNSSVIPVWNAPVDIEKEAPTNSQVNNIPLWDIKPTIESGNEEKTVDTQNNAFWIPIPEKKEEDNSFPRINIPVIGGSTNNSNNNLDFPAIGGQ